MFWCIRKDINLKIVKKKPNAGKIYIMRKFQAPIIIAIIIEIHYLILI